MAVSCKENPDLRKAAMLPVMVALISTVRSLYFVFVIYGHVQKKNKTTVS